jgi:hypothetical protein
MNQNDDRLGAMISLGLMVAVLAVCWLLSWVVGRWSFAWAVTKAYGVLWLGFPIASAVVLRVFRALRINLHDRGSIYVGVFVLLTIVCGLFFAAFVALEVSRASQGAAWFVIAVLHFLALLALWVANENFAGSVYKLVGLFSLLFGFVVFRVFSGIPQALFAWLG